MELIKVFLKRFVKPQKSIPVEIRLPTSGRFYPRVAKDSLQRAPVPALDHTLHRYLEYAKVLGSPQQYERTQSYVQQFRTSGQAQNCQTRLEQLALNTDNWVNKFWLEDMYLRTNRVALPVNSNPAYIFPNRKFQSVEDQVQYAAALLRGIQNFKTKIDTRSLPQELSTGREKVPLCMDQYWRLFSTYREPGLPQDVQHTELPSGPNEHIIAMIKNQCFVVRTKVGGQLLSDTEISYQLMDAHQKSLGRAPICVMPVPAYTTVQRDQAATTLNMLKQHPTNAVSLHWIKHASMILCFDESTEDFKEKLDPQKTMNEEELNWAHAGHNILHGYGRNGCNRWYNKTQNFVMNEAGGNGLLIEHSCAEGMVFINMIEQALSDADALYSRKKLAAATRRYESKPLTWHIEPALQSILKDCQQQMNTLAMDLELNVLMYKSFGREFIKAHKMSPDAFLQLMLQLTYYRSHGKLCSTYESAGLRRYRCGRVDNIRSAHPEALKFAQTMLNNDATFIDKKKALEQAIQKQTTIMTENISGEGIDNHLVGLRNMARELYPEPGAVPLFTSDLHDEVMRFPLSTSQVTTSVEGTYLCYGPVTPDGYGCAYNAKPHQLIFAISAFHSCDWTSAVLFRRSLIEALDQIKHLLEN